MSSLYEFWDVFDNLPSPVIPEIEAHLQKEGISLERLCHNGHVSREYLPIQKLYHFIFSMLFLSKSALSRMDNRMSKRGLPICEQKQSFYQKYDYMGLRYFYLRSLARVDMLSDEQLACFSQCLENRENEKLLRQVADIVKNTYQFVMALAPKIPNQRVELFPSIHGEGLILGKSLVLGMCSPAVYNERGMLLDRLEDDRRMRSLLQIKEQLEPILEAAISMDVTIIIEG